MAQELAREKTADLSRLAVQHGPFHKHEYLYRQGSDFQSFFIIRSGAVKTYNLAMDGSEKIVGFYLPGDLFGFDGLSNNQHANSAVALETSSVCEIPIQALSSLCGQRLSLQRQLLSIMGKEILQGQQMMMLLTQKNAEQRLASFLLKLSEHFKSRNLSAIFFKLPMKHKDMANYLGLAVKTLSRLFKRFQAAGWLSIHRGEVNLTSLKALKNLSVPAY